MTEIDWREKVKARARNAARMTLQNLAPNIGVALANLYADKIADAVVKAVSPVPSFWDAAMDRAERERQS